MPSTSESSDLLAAVLLMRASLAFLSIRSALFIVPPPLVRSCEGAEQHADEYVAL